ncbi:MAG: hypothetical protein JO307_29185 [Bryobacterales bacterium]|nr:hypothetical protein [Bryobacterales bacterium]MBV9400454.1 hypothetical protein [Bryobacterales bacterium]
MKATTFVFIIVFSSFAAAQPIGAGIKLGTTLTDAISSLPSFPIQNTNHFIVGPYVEVRLPLGLAVEGDALYQRGLYGNVTNGSGSGSTWQFPIVLKYKFLEGPIRPYVEGGPTFSHTADIYGELPFVAAIGETPFLNHRSNFGITLGGGIEVRILKLRVSPEVRYNGFTVTNIQDPSGLFHSNRNMATFTMGFGF